MTDRSRRTAVVTTWIAGAVGLIAAGVCLWRASRGMVRLLSPDGPLWRELAPLVAGYAMCAIAAIVLGAVIRARVWRAAVALGAGVGMLACAVGLLFWDAHLVANWLRVGRPMFRSACELTVPVLIWLPILGAVYARQRLPESRVARVVGGVACAAGLAVIMLAAVEAPYRAMTERPRAFSGATVEANRLLLIMLPIAVAAVAVLSLALALVSLLPDRHRRRVAALAFAVPQALVMASTVAVWILIPTYLSRFVSELDLPNLTVLTAIWVMLLAAGRHTAVALGDLLVQAGARWSARRTRDGETMDIEWSIHG